MIASLYHIVSGSGLAFGASECMCPETVSNRAREASIPFYTHLGTPPAGVENSLPTRYAIISAMSARPSPLCYGFAAILLAASTLSSQPPSTQDPSADLV